MSPRGGRRSGTPGKSYGERTDLNKTRAPVAISGQGYGVQAQQLRDQQAVPVGPAPTPSGVSAPIAPGPTGLPSTPVVPLDAPTMRPNEPLTAGVNIGPGPGAPLGASDDIGDELRALYVSFPYPGIRELLEDLDG